METLACWTLGLSRFGS